MASTSPTSEGDTPDIVHFSQDLGNGSVLDGMEFGILGRDVFAEPLFSMDNISITTTFAESVPEPATLGLACLGLVALAGRRRR